MRRRKHDPDHPTKFKSGIRRSEFIKAAAMVAMGLGLPGLARAQEMQGNDPGGSSGTHHGVVPGKVPPVAGDSKALSRYSQSLNYVVVTPEGPKDGGDFGAYTPGTRTAGIQEALDFAQKSRSKTWPGQWSARNIYIARGIYTTDATITVPWMGECWVLEATGSLIHYRGTDGDALVIDSQMNNQLKFGYVVAGALQHGAVVHVRPTQSLPHAPQGVVTCSRIEFYAIVGSGDVVSRKVKAPRGIGLLLEAGSGPIVENMILCDEINACDISLELRNPPDGAGILDNDIQVLFNHLCNVPILLGQPGTVGLRDNHITTNIESYKGARVFGNNNFIQLLGTQVESGPAITFEADAHDNVVCTTSLLKSVLDKSTKPTNRIVSNSPVGYGLETPAFPNSGAELVNRTAYAVEVAIIRTGVVSSWEQADANGRTIKFDAGLAAGQHFRIEPGDSMKFDYSQAPSWRWKASR